MADRTRETPLNVPPATPRPRTPGWLSPPPPFAGADDDAIDVDLSDLEDLRAGDSPPPV